jgi:hypothetical protein
MKINLVTILSLASLTTFFIACDDQSESRTVQPVATTSGQISIDGNAANTKAGILQYSTRPVKSATFYRHELGLVTDGFTTLYNESTGLILQGDGTGVWLTLNSPSTILAPGTYSFADSQSAASAFDFWYGSVDVKGKNYRFTSGEIVVTENKGVYTITVDGIVATHGSSIQKEIKVSYTGALKSFESK